jgi:hypothetical protein
MERTATFSIKLKSNRLAHTPTIHRQFPSIQMLELADT